MLHFLQLSLLYVSDGVEGRDGHGGSWFLNHVLFLVFRLLEDQVHLKDNRTNTICTTSKTSCHL